jgi:hypothetical protein
MLSVQRIYAQSTTEHPDMSKISRGPSRFAGFAYFICANIAPMYSDLVSSGVCVCGHERAAHEHHRSALDCALCPAGECVHFRPATPVRYWLDKLAARLSRRQGHREEPRDEKDTGDGSAVNI